VPCIPQTPLAKIQCSGPLQHWLLPVFSAFASEMLTQTIHAIAESWRCEGLPKADEVVMTKVMTSEGMEILDEKRF